MKADEVSTVVVPVGSAMRVKAEPIATGLPPSVKAGPYIMPSAHGQSHNNTGLPTNKERDESIY